MEGILSLKWNNHLSVLFHSLSSLYKKDLYSDVTLACGGQFFPVHKLVLSACSEFFEDLFKQTPCSHPVVVLKDVLVTDLEALLSYMYLGEANVVQSDLSRLIKAAECLCIKGLAVPDEAGTGSKLSVHSTATGVKRTHAHNDDSPHTKKRRIDKNDKTDNHATVGSNSTATGGGADTSVSIPSTTSCSSSSSTGREEDGTGKGGASRLPPRSSSEGEGGREGGAVMQDLAEVVLEEDEGIIKEEVPDPKCDADVEEILTRSNRAIDEGGGGGGGAPTAAAAEEDEEEEDEIAMRLSRSFTSVLSDSRINDGGSNDLGPMSLYDHHLAATHPVGGVLQELIMPAVPGPSDIPPWEYPMEGEDSRSSHNLEYVGTNSSSVVEEAAAAAAVTLSCPYCQRTFTYRSDLNRHVRSHTGEKPYTCRYCDYRATQKSHLNEHMKRRHQNLM